MNFWVIVRQISQGEVPVAAQKAASQMLQQEKQGSEARHPKRVLAKVQGGAITRIEVMEDGVYVEKMDQTDVEHHTMEIRCARFQLQKIHPSAKNPCTVHLAHSQLCGAGGNGQLHKGVSTNNPGECPSRQQRLPCEITRKIFNCIGKNQKSARRLPFLVYTMAITRRRQQKAH
jgi:hypothetical protein